MTLEYLTLPLLLLIALVLVSAVSNAVISRLSAAVLAMSPALALGGFGIATVWQALTGLVTVTRLKEAGRHAVVPALVVLACLRLLSLIWSPNSNLVIGKLLSVAVLLLALLGTVVAENERPGSARRTILLLSPLVIAQSIALVVFRIDPSLEAVYLGSNWGSFFLGGQAADIVSGAISNNVTDPEKAAGLFFINGNRASMLQGVFFFVFAMVALIRRNIIAILTMVVAGAGVWAAGSKTGIGLLIVLPVAAVLFAAFARRDRADVKASVYVIALVLVLAGSYLVSRYAQDYLMKVDETLVPRFVLWRTAIGLIEGNLLTGIGAGGWEREWTRIAVANGLQTNIPPHNFLLSLGVENGLPAVGLLVVIMTLLLRMSCRGITATVSGRERLAISCGAFAWVWVFIHGMGDNTDFYGVTNAVPFLVSVLAIRASTRVVPPSEPARSARTSVVTRVVRPSRPRSGRPSDSQRKDVDSAGALGARSRHAAPRWRPSEYESRIDSAPTTSRRPNARTPFCESPEADVSGIEPEQ